MASLAADEEHLVKRHRIARLNVELLNEDNVALLDAVLLATGLNDCVHALHLLYIISPGFGGVFQRACEPAPSGCPIYYNAIMSLFASSDFWLNLRFSPVDRPGFLT